MTQHGPHKDGVLGRVVMIEGAVAGVLSAMLISMGGSDRELTEKLKAAKMWMREQKIPHAGTPNRPLAPVENARLEEVS